jgi:MFS family permease
MSSLHEAPLGRPPHPFLYTLLIVPFGAASGFVSVALAFLATKHGLTVEEGALLVAANMFPNVWKFFWAPIADKTLTRKRWYVLSVVGVALSMFAMSVVPLGRSTLNLMTALVLLSSFGATFIGFSIESIVAHVTPPAQRGSVSGWFQAGNLGGNGIGGGIGLALLNDMPAPWMAGAVITVLMLLCMVPLPFVPEVKAEASTGSPMRAMRDVAADLWSVLKSGNGVLCAVLCFVPIGTGAVTSVLAQAEVAQLWGAGEHEVALVQGFATGIVSGRVPRGRLRLLALARRAGGLRGVRRVDGNLHGRGGDRAAHGGGLRGLQHGLRLHHRALLRGVLRVRTRRDRRRPRGHQVQRLRVALERTHLVHGPGARVGAHEVGTDRDAHHRVRAGRRRHSRVRAGAAGGEAVRPGAGARAVVSVRAPRE